MKIFVKDLSEGIHEFHDEIPVQNVELSEPDFYPNALSLDLYVDRLDNMYRVKITIRTTAKYICHRCLDEYDTTFDETAEQIYQLGAGNLDGDDEVEILPGDSTEIDITKAISDLFVVNRPIKLLCNETCKGLCVNCGINLNHKKCNCETVNIDPRLEKLKTLLN